MTRSNDKNIYLAKLLRLGVIILARIRKSAALFSLAPPQWSSVSSHFLDQCSQVKDEGICPGNVPRIYFDQTAKRCLLFSYGGCGGNTNNFLTEDSCIATCGGPTGALIHAIQLHGNIQSEVSTAQFSWIFVVCPAYHICTHTHIIYAYTHISYMHTHTYHICTHTHITVSYTHLTLPTILLV